MLAHKKPTVKSLRCPINIGTRRHEHQFSGNVFQKLRRAIRRGWGGGVGNLVSMSTDFIRHRLKSKTKTTLESPE